MLRIFMGVVVLGFGLGDASPAGSDVKVEAQPAVFQSVELPYEGYGTVSVWDDGLLEVRVGGGPVPNPGKGEAWYYPEKIFVLSPATTNLALVATDGEWLLQTDGARLAECAFSFADAAEKTFDRYVTEGYARQGLVKIKGELSLTFDAETGVYQLVMLGEEAHQNEVLGLSEEVADVLRVSFRTKPEHGQPAVEAAGERVKQKPDPKPAQSCCETNDCRHGDCTQCCDFPKYAICGCDAEGYGDCNCVDRPTDITVLAS